MLTFPEETTSTATAGSAGSLPGPLQRAQDAMHLPEVQDLLRQLAPHNLGIFMPHQHDLETGAFLPMEDNVVQVETGLEVSFEPAEDILDQLDRYVMTGWVWKNGAASLAAMCRTSCEKRGTDTQHYPVHKDK